MYDFFSVGSMIEKSKVHKPHSYTKSHVKYKYALTSYQDISSRVSNKIDSNFKRDENPSQEFL